MASIWSASGSVAAMVCRVRSLPRRLTLAKSTPPILLAAETTTLWSAASRAEVDGVFDERTGLLDSENAEAATQPRSPGTSLTEHACVCDGRCRVLAASKTPTLPVGMTGSGRAPPAPPDRPGRYFG